MEKEVKNKKERRNKCNKSKRKNKRKENEKKERKGELFITLGYLARKHCFYGSWVRNLIYSPQIIRNKYRETQWHTEGDSEREREIIEQKGRK